MSMLVFLIYSLFDKVKSNINLAYSLWRRRSFNNVNYSSLAACTRTKSEELELIHLISFLMKVVLAIALLKAIYSASQEDLCRLFYRS
jgi:hypothetical protein